MSVIPPAAANSLAWPSTYSSHSQRQYSDWKYAGDRHTSSTFDERSDAWIRWRQSSGPLISRVSRKTS